MAEALTGIMDAVAAALVDTGAFGEVLQYDVIPQLEADHKYPVCIITELSERLNGKQDDQCEDRSNTIGIAIYSNKRLPADRVKELRTLGATVYEALENKSFGTSHPVHWQRKDTSFTSNMVPRGVRLDVYDAGYHLDRGDAGL